MIGSIVGSNGPGSLESEGICQLDGESLNGEDREAYTMKQKYMKAGMLLIASLCLLSCASTQEPQAVDEPEVLGIEGLVVTTAVVPVTFEPATRSETSFSESARQLYACFQVRGGELPLSLSVSWLRAGDDEPLSRARLVATGYRWMAASYEGGGRLRPGSYLVRVAAGDQLLGETEFTITASARGPSKATGGVTLSGLRLVRELDGQGHPVGVALTVLSQGSSSAHCAFIVRDAPPGTGVFVRWDRGDTTVSTTNLGQITGTRELVATLTLGQGLSAGLYRAVVLINGAEARSLVFTVEGASELGRSGPRVENLVLTTAVEPGTGRPVAPPLTRVPVDVGTVYLSFSFTGMPLDEILQVRWYRDDQPDTPLASSSFQVAGRGSLAASLRLEGELEGGAYRVVVVRQGRTLGSLSFSVEASPGLR